jgi:tight adherence protein B
MSFAIATFVLCLGAVLGLYWGLVVRPETRQARAITSRLGRFDRPAPQPATGVTAVDTGQHVVPALEALLQRHQGFTRALDQLILEAGMALSAERFLLASFGAAVLGGIAGFLWFGVWPLVVIAAGLGGFVPLLVVRRRRAQRLAAFEEQFPEAIDLVARALRAGHAFTTGLGIAADEMPAPVGIEFKRVYDQQNFGMSMPEALRAMARRVPVLDARFFVTAVLTQRESGGNLAEVLDNLSSVMRDRFKVRRQIRVISTHGRISGWVLSMVPPVLAVFMYSRQPALLRILIDDPLGMRLVIAAVFLQLLGVYAISRMVRIEY